MEIASSALGFFDIAIAVVVFHVAIIYFAVIGVRKTLTEVRAGRAAKLAQWMPRVNAS